ncbi:cytochrome c peroxidase [Borealophlyctis nickersoniae]|nr:cytochrome c peroxidase [Borealophlyctis nickersoniae]
MAPHDYDAVKRDIAAILKKPDYDDGSIGPVLVRLAWHASGTYDAKTGKGGSDGATMRFEPEMTDAANAGLERARAFLEPVKQKHPWISYADLWTLAGATAIEEMGGPSIPWRPGRADLVADNIVPDDVPENGRLPDASQGAAHVRDVFNRMGFTDREIVALIGAHGIGRCHSDRSGYEGPWTYTPTRFSNQFFVLLTTVDWQPKKWDGPLQYADPDDELMMLPADMVFRDDPVFGPISKEYAKSKEVFYKDFASAFGKLLELGVRRDKAMVKLQPTGGAGGGCPFSGAVKAKL